MSHHTVPNMHFSADVFVALIFGEIKDHSVHKQV